AEHVLHAGFRFCGIGSGGPQYGSAAKVDAFDALDSESYCMLGVALGEPPVSVTHAEDFEALVYAFNGRGADDAIDSRCGSAPNQDCQFAFRNCVCHIVINFLLPCSSSSSSSSQSI